jgi:hypothetical protein
VRVLVALLVIGFVQVAGARPPKPAPKVEGYLTITSQPYAVIYVDGKRLGETPLVKIALYPGRHVVRAVRENGDAQRINFDIDAGKTVEHKLRWDGRDAADTNGYLRLSSTPVAKIWIDGVDTGQLTPISGVAVAPGRHKVSFVVGSDRYTFAVKVEAGETAVLHKVLQ